MRRWGHYLRLRYGTKLCSVIHAWVRCAGINYMRDRPEPPKEVYRPPTPPPPAGEDEAEAEVIEREEERLAAEEEEQLLDEVLVPDEELADEDDDGADVIEPGRLTAEEETELIAAKAAASVLLDGPEAVLPPRQARARVNPRFGSP